MKNRFKNWLITKIAYSLLQLACYSSRYLLKWPEKMKGINSFKELKEAVKQPLIIVFWHDEILLSSHIFTKMCHFPMCAVISKSRDGKVLSSIVKNFPHIDVIEVAHDARSEAFQDIVQALQKGRVVLITPDGPRGPWKTVKKGVALAAKKSGAKVLAITSICNRSWKLPTGDRLKFPIPASRISVKMEFAEYKQEENGRTISSSIEKTLNRIKDS